ncbi:MAG: 3-oxoacyl-ACP reductase FabG [Burkholderiales bacterium]|nr:3-oxoacyl-ACP reductase FabG [Burkholderiales bacterium]
MLEGQIALVTGASRGIGRSIALDMGKHGATVIGTATSASGADSITDYLKEANIEGVGLMLNVNDVNRIDAALAEIRSRYGEVSILVNNAGITKDNLVMRMSDEEWDVIMETNLKSVFRMSRAVLRAMAKARYGRIINISSVVGAMGNAGQANYAAAKAGIFGFSKSLAREIGSRNVTVNSIAPGFIDTDMTRALSDSQRDSLLQHVPLGRLGHPEDVAAAATFLASPAAGYITGTTLHVNGGLHME